MLEHMEETEDIKRKLTKQCVFYKYSYCKKGCDCKMKHNYIGQLSAGNPVTFFELSIRRSYRNKFGYIVDERAVYVFQTLDFHNVYHKKHTYDDKGFPISIQGLGAHLNNHIPSSYEDFCVGTPKTPKEMCNMVLGAIHNVQRLIHNIILVGQMTSVLPRELCDIIHKLYLSVVSRDKAYTTKVSFKDETGYPALSLAASSRR